MTLIQFISINNGYFKGPEQVSFEAAKSYCQDQGTSLASIPTESQYNDAVDAADGSEVWIGLQDEVDGDGDMIWSWTDGTPIASNYGFNSDRTATTGQGPWHSGEPNEHIGNEEDCVEIYTTGGYNDIPCNDNNYPLCNDGT